MNRIEFIGIISGTIGVVGTTAYLLSDNTNLVRADPRQVDDNNKNLKPDGNNWNSWLGSAKFLR